jgi:tetratricopeptide (TPR) repeat protein
MSHKMRGRVHVPALAALLFCVLVLAGCGSPDARRASHLARGERYLAEGNLQKAQLEFRNAIQIAPQRADARVLSGEVTERLGDIRGAAAWYQSAIDVDGQSVSARVHLGRVYVLGSSPNRALEIIEPAIHQHPDDPKLLVVRAGARAELNDEVGALADANRAAELAPRDEDVVALLAALYRNEGNAARAIDLLQGALHAHPGSRDLRRVLANLYTQDGKYDLAAGEISKLIALDPKDLASREQLAELYERANQSDKAERVLKEAIAAVPQRDEPKLAYVRFLSSRGSEQDAARALADFVARNPSDYGLQLAQGDFLLQHDRQEAAVAVFRRVVDRAGELPQGLVARNRLAAILVTQRRFDAASQLIGHVLAGSPRDSDALILRAGIALEQGQAATAITDLRTVVRDQPRSVPVLRMLAAAYLSDGQQALAEEALRSAMDIDPRDAVVRTALAQLLAKTYRIDAAIALLNDSAHTLQGNVLIGAALVQAYLAKPDLEAAAKAASDLMRAAPKSWNGPYEAGLVAEARKRDQDAEADFERALSLDPEGIDALRAVSRVDSAAGRADRAIARVQSLVSTEPVNAAACDLLGELRFANHDAAGAVRELTRCVGLAPTWWLPYHDLGVAQLASGDSAGAARTYEQGVASTRMELALVIDAASLEEQQGRVDDAIRQYEEFHQEFPGRSIATNNLAMLLVTYKNDHSSIERARDLTSRFMTSTNPDLLDTAGWVRVKSGDAAGALMILQEAARLAPQSRVIRYHLGMAELALGQRDLARASLEASLAGSARFEGSDDARAALARLGS